VIKLLIVDGSSIIRKKIKSAIELPDIVVVGKAEDGDKALRLFEQLQPDIVILDLMMPAKSGVQCVAPMLRNKPDCRILIMSALADSRSALAAIKQGAHGFLGKPFSAGQLNDALAELLKPAD
jgi:two-component system chemotaxis response regulator CheY